MWSLSYCEIQFVSVESSIEKPFSMLRIHNFGIKTHWCWLAKTSLTFAHHPASGMNSMETQEREREDANNINSNQQNKTATMEIYAKSWSCWWCWCWENLENILLFALDSSPHHRPVYIVHLLIVIRLYHMRISTYVSLCIHFPFYWIAAVNVLKWCSVCRHRLAFTSFIFDKLCTCSRLSIHIEYLYVSNPSHVNRIDWMANTAILCMGVWSVRGCERECECACIWPQLKSMPIATLP